MTFGRNFFKRAPKKFPGIKESLHHQLAICIEQNETRAKTMETREARTFTSMKQFTTARRVFRGSIL